MKQGKAYLQKHIKGFNNAARATPFFVLTDLDTISCAPLLIRQWLPTRTHPNLLFRVAVTEAESWIMADRNGLAEFLGIQAAAIPAHPDTVQHAKEALVSLAGRSTKKDVREALVPARNSSAKVGPDYNARLGLFVEQRWCLDEAKKRSPSLKKATEALDCFRPVLLPHQRQERYED